MIDLSATTTALTAAGMLTAWSHGHALIDHAASSAPAAGGSGPGAVQQVRPRRFLVVLDEMWRALRGSSALVEHADALTRIYRHRGVAHLMLTHSLDDLAAADTIADRAKTAGLLERCAITALTATSDRELEAITRQRHLTGTERALVSSWSSAATWHPGTGHPGRGHYLLKAGDRPGIPVHMPLVGDEPDLYHTDPVALP